MTGTPMASGLDAGASRRAVHGDRSAGSSSRAGALALRSRPGTVRAVCFDLLSALLDSWSVWDRVAAELGRAELGHAWRRRYLSLTSTAGGYRPYLDVVVEAGESVGLPSRAADLLERAWDELRPWPDVGPALARLGVPAAVVTNCSEALGRRAVACVHFPFAVVVTAEEAGSYKPDPAPYRLACERLGCTSPEVAYVAGSPFDARGALAQGFRVTWVNRPGDPVGPALARATVVATLEGWAP